jgi:hypothetical protein
MSYKTDYGKGLSPCAISKAKHALGLKKQKPTGGTFCTANYWGGVCRSIRYKENLSSLIVEKAINSYSEYY